MPSFMGTTNGGVTCGWFALASPGQSGDCNLARLQWLGWYSRKGILCEGEARYEEMSKELALTAYKLTSIYVSSLRSHHPGLGRGEFRRYHLHVALFGVEQNLLPLWLCDGYFGCTKPHRICTMDNMNSITGPPQTEATIRCVAATFGGVMRRKRSGLGWSRLPFRL